MRDVSKILSDTEFVKLRALLSQQPGGMDPIGPHEFEQYPKVLYHPDWITCWRIIKTSPDELLKKQAKEQMKHVQVIVHDPEQEEDFLLDGWRADPNELIVEFNTANGVAHPDPRVPTGREGRRAKQAAALTREEEILRLRLRYAELTGTPIEQASDDAPATTTAAASARVPEQLGDPARDAPRPARKATPKPSRPAPGRKVAPAVNPREAVKAAAARSASARA